MYILYMYTCKYLYMAYVITGDHYIMDFSTDCSVYVCERESIQIVHVIMYLYNATPCLFAGGGLICCIIYKVF